MNRPDHWTTWLRDLTPADDECNRDAADAEQQWARERCLTCGGTGYVADCYGEAEACDCCGDYADAVAEAIVAEVGMPF